MSRDQNAVQNHSAYIYIYIYIGNLSFERVEKFSYLGTSLRNQNSFHEEIKCRLLSESFIFQFAVQKYKRPDVWNYNFVSCFVWV